MTGSDVFQINPHAVETMSASGLKSETFDFDSGFGQAAITGFLATGSTHDVIQVDTSMFTYLNAGMVAGAGCGGVARQRDPRRVPTSRSPTPPATS